MARLSTQIETKQKMSLQKIAKDISVQGLELFKSQKILISETK